MIALDDFNAFKSLDPQDMLSQLDGLPEQLETAWQLGQKHDLPNWTGIRQVVIAGMGGSAIGGDLLAAYAEPVASVPVFIHRDYELPNWVRGPETLVIASSHSGNTEETLSAFSLAHQRGCRCLVISRGGQLGEAARQIQAPVWTFEHTGQPRAAVGYSFGLLLAAFSRLGFLPNPQDELVEALAAMRAQAVTIQAHIPAAQNSAKRLAGQIYGRILVAIGAGGLAPVARRWKGQVNELAKAWGQFDHLPETDHNTLAGVVFPEDVLARLMVIFLSAPSDHLRNQQRLQLTRTGMMLEGLNTDIYLATGNSRLAHQWTAIQFGDYTAYYLAMAYEIDPTPIPAIENLKDQMKG